MSSYTSQLRRVFTSLTPVIYFPLIATKFLLSLRHTGRTFDPATDIPDLSGKVILITGGNIGLGLETALQLSKHNPEHIYLACRSREKCQAAIKHIEALVPSACLTFLQCDLASLPSVVAAAETFLSQAQRLDLLFLNAGVMALPPGKTEQGYEIQFETNHIGHALLTKLLLPILVKTAEEKEADVRVIAVASLGHIWPAYSGISFQDLKTEQENISTWARYGQSKLANILFVKELSRRYAEKGITAVAVHPGLVDTDLYSSFEGIMWGLMAYANQIAKKLIYLNVQSGALNQLWASVAKIGDVKTGEFYMPVGVSGQGSQWTRDGELAKKLWDWTERELEGYEVH